MNNDNGYEKIYFNLQTENQCSQIYGLIRIGVEFQFISGCIFEYVQSPLIFMEFRIF